MREQIHAFQFFAVIPVLAVIIAGQASFVPLPLTLFWSLLLMVLFWRMRTQHSIAVAKHWQLLFVLVGLVLVFAQFGRLWGVQPGVAFLTTCFIAKCLESQNARDFIVVYNFGLFVTASLFLHSQAIWLAALVLLGLVFAFVGLFRIQTAPFMLHGSLKPSLKQDALHVLKSVSIAVPFFILLFMFFPRLPPVWSVPIPENQAVTGINDRMSPGDIAQISQSSALAFRVLGNMQQWSQRSDLYWRAMVLDQYDGVTWTSHRSNLQYASIRAQQLQGVAYQYIPAQPNQKWVMSLEHSVPTQAAYRLFIDGRIEPVRLQQRTQPIALFRLSQPLLLSQTDASTLQLNTRYIAQRDPRAQQLARQLWSQSQAQPSRYVQNVLAWYQRHGFAYTLAPGKLRTNNRIDQFLFEQRQGFCEHYASSFVLLMRYAGIPARVVVGYQGGQAAPDGQSWEVRQLDAHAWAEVWLNGQWQRVDPTAIIAPQRIDGGMQRYVGNNRNVWGNGNAWQAQSFEWLKNARIWSDYLSYQWQSKVVGYDVDAQKNWLARLGLNSSYAGVLLLIAGFMVLGGIFAAGYWLKRYYATPVLVRVLQQFNRKLKKTDQRLTAETVQQWMQRLAQRYPHASFARVADVYASIQYANEPAQAHLRQLRQLLKDCATVIRAAQ